jgi:hypothetical protein
MKTLEIIDNKTLIPMRDNGGGFIPPKGVMPMYKFKPTPKLDRRNKFQNFIKRLKMIKQVICCKSVITVVADIDPKYMDIEYNALHISPINQEAIFRAQYIENHDVAKYKELVEVNKLSIKN